MNSGHLLRAAAAVALMCSSGAPAAAHAVRLTCEVTADELVVRVGFGRSARPAADAGVRLVGPDGVLVSAGATGASGEVRFPRPAPGRYRVEVVADDHDAEAAIDVPAPAVSAVLDARPPERGSARWLAVAIPVGAVLGLTVLVVGRARPTTGARATDAPRSSHPLARGNRLRSGAAMLVSVVALYGGSLPNDTASDWFKSLARPDVLPRELERLIPFIWLGLFLLGGVGLAAVWAAARPARWKWAVCGLLVAQLALNYGYSYTFTVLRDIPAAFWLAVALAAVTAAVVGVAAAARVWLTAACSVPYLAWVTFATYVTHLLARLNP